ncbi:MAG: hypothetical protein P8X47_08815 [Ignavibacteriaceae bacterium]
MKKVFFCFLMLTGISFPQQIGDPEFNPPIINPAYPTGEGSKIYIDEAHNNFHTLEGRYKPFAELLERDGYVINSLKDTIHKNTLENVDILVISNALNIRNTENWTLPTPSAFTEEEIKNIVDWVMNGGSLFLIADHMPFPSAVDNLANEFGFKLNNGFAIDTTNKTLGDLFTRKDSTLEDNFITNGRSEQEKVDSIYSFTGEAFRIPKDATPVLILNYNFISLMPDTAWNFKQDTPKISVSGWSQGSVKKFGKGKIAMWGEAAMFSAQIAGEQKIKVGMNSPKAKHNYQLLLNIIHWLDSRLQ